MSEEDAMKCVLLLERAFGWKVRFYTMRSHKEEEWWLYSITPAGNAFEDDSPRVFFSRFGIPHAAGDDSAYFTKKSAAVSFAEDVSGSCAALFRRGAASPAAVWRVPEFGSAAELELKLAVAGGCL